MIIAAGLILGSLQQYYSFHFELSGYAVVKAGVALFIILPVARVALMMAIFLRDRDYLYMSISMLVLVIISAGIVFEL